MRIGINLLCILPGVNGGIETYATSTLRALAALDSWNEYVVFVNHRGAALEVLDAPNFTKVVCNVDGRVRGLRYGWEHLVLPRQVVKYGLDVLHSPGYQGPIRCPCPTVVTLPDLNFAFPGTLPLYKRLVLRFFCSRAARHASRVITLSEFSKRQIVEQLGIPKQNVTVTPAGPGIEIPKANWSLVQKRHKLSANYIVAFAGGNYPHKNMSRLLMAFEAIRAGDVSLAIIGELSPELRSMARKLNGRVLELGFVENSHISPVLSHARLCMFPSLYEGFGFPTLEAQSAGVPLACSDAAPLPEVAGNGARLFNPESVEDMAAAMEHCLGDRVFCDALVRAGRENVKRFSWEKTARETLAVYHAAAGVSAASRAGVAV